MASSTIPFISWTGDAGASSISTSRKTAAAAGGSSFFISRRAAAAGRSTNNFGGPRLPDISVSRLRSLLINFTPRLMLPPSGDMVHNMFNLADNRALGVSMRSQGLSQAVELPDDGFNKAVNGVVEGDAVIIVDHGSRRKESNLMLNEFVTMFRDKTKYPIVEPAHMELAEPSIRDAFDLCVQQGARRVIVSPFFLFPGRHWSQDIPSLTAEAAKDHPGVSYVVTAPLGLHELLVDVVHDRISYCLSHVAGEVEECSVCAGTGKCQLYS